MGDPETVAPPTCYSRPDLRPPSLTISIHDQRATQGHIFTSPYFLAQNRPDSGPYIFDGNGTLVWSGLDAVGAAGKTDVQGLHLCRYQNEDHLCLWQGEQRGTHGSGLGVIMNKKYQIVKTIQSGSATSSCDLHEFKLTPTNTALLTLYQPRFFRSMWILDSCFQEIGLADGHLIFEWCALEHVDLSESHVPAGSFGLAGDGRSKDTSWDYLHLNSIDKSAEGDYLVSARHTDTVFKISHLDGLIIWRLNGDLSSFQLQNFSFQRQHDARFMEESNTSAILSLFNNDNDGFTRKNNPSTGLLLHLDFESWTAQQLTKYSAPTVGGIESRGMGNLQLLPNDHVFIGFGQDSAMAEYLADGSPVWYAELGWHSFNYRAFRGQWVGEPVQPPALWTYSRSTNSTMTFYVSWNGATDVLYWQFYTSDSKNGVYNLIGSIEKNGFETNFTHDLSQPWAFVEAVGRDGTMKNSSRVKTYIPEPDLASTCGTFHCFPDVPLDNTSQLEDWATAISGDQPGSGRIERTELLMWTEHVFSLVGIILCLLHGWRLIRNFLGHSRRYSRIDNGGY